MTAPKTLDLPSFFSAVESSPMMKIPLSSALLLSLASGLVAAESTATLTPGMLLAPSTVITPSDKGKPNISGGLVRPGHFVTLKTGKADSKSITVGSLSLELSLDKGNVSLGLDGKSKTLPVADGAIKDPVLLKLESMAKYPICFPYVNGGRAEVSIGYRSAMVLKTSVGGSEISILDDNLDGQFAHASTDAYQNGRGPAYAPLGTHIATKNSVFKINAISPDGKSLKYEPVTEGVHKLTLSYKGANCDFAMGSENGLSFTSALNTAQKTQTLQVLDGTYAPLYGLVMCPRGSAAAIMIPGKAPSVEVKADTEYALGAPYTLSFTMETSGSTCSVSPYSIKLHGQKGEEYLGFRYDSLPSLAYEKGGKTIPFFTFSYG
jgi:hypothetical protein